MTDKNSVKRKTKKFFIFLYFLSQIRNEIDYTQQVIYKLEHELRQLEEQYRPSDDKILK